MINARTLASCAAGMVLLGPVIQGEGLSQYRNFVMGSTLASVSTLTGLAPAEAKTIHQRPAVIQVLDWRPSTWIPGSTSLSTDPVERIAFSFYNDQLFRVVVDYAYERTEGMTDNDMVQAISAVYGTPVKRTPGAVRVASGIDIESGSTVARWGDAGHAAVLYRTSSYREAFRLIVIETALDDLARKAAIQGTRLDEQDAPRREIAREKKQQTDRLEVAAKARIANKAVFRP